MSRELPIGSSIALTGSPPRTFRITEHLGLGGACVAYRVTFEERGGIRHSGVLKEYCPAYLGVDRSSVGDFRVVVPERFRSRFESGARRFREAYREICAYLAQHDAAANYHPVPLGLYFGNGTVYSLSSRDYGASYDKTQDHDLKSLLLVIQSLAEAIAQYHEAGFLHLDIKPENVFILNGVRELVKLFDYDSLLRPEDLRGSEHPVIPHPGAYYVPELDDGRLREIGVRTDFFEIGALLFLRLFRRPPARSEMERSAVYPWDEAPLLAGASPQAKFELEVLLRNTLQISVRRRYPNDEALLAQIKKVVSLVREVGPHLQNLPKWQPSSCRQGREAELREIRARLLKDGCVFLRGMGGIGKSELAKLYAAQYAESYHTVQFRKYTDSLQLLTAGLPVFGINDADYPDPAALAEAKRRILHQCDSHTLLIVDNFNVTYDRDLRDFLPADAGGFHVIFTTRCEPAQEYYAPMVLQVTPLPREDCLRLFRLQYGQPLDAGQTEDALVLIDRVERNTLILILAAKAMRRAGLTPAQMTDRFETQTADQIRPEIFLEYDSSDADTEAYNRLYGHLCAVFLASGLSAAEQKALRCMTLISPIGLPLQELRRGCADDPEIAEQAESLRALGWIGIEADERITVHQIVSDILAGNPDLPRPEVYLPFYEYLLDRCDPGRLLHHTEAIAQLADVIQLNRRCADLPAEDRIIVKARLGILYANLYRARDARSLLAEAETLSRGEHGAHLSEILLNRAELEGRFGRPEEALRLLEQAIQAGQEEPSRDGDTVLEAMLALAQAQSENNENEAALHTCDRAITFASKYEWKDLLQEFFPLCEALCRELDDPDRLAHYQKLQSELSPGEASPEEEPSPLPGSALQSFLNDGNTPEARREFEHVLDQCRGIFGAESPLYQDIECSRWILSALCGDKEQTFRDLSASAAFVEQYFGAESVEMAELLSMEGRLLPGLGALDAALEAAQRAAAILERQNSTRSYAFVRAKLAQADINLLWGRLPEAEALVDSIPFDAFDGTTYLMDLISSAGPLLVSLSRYEQAQALCRRVFRHRNAGADALAFANLVSAACYEEQGSLSEAEAALAAIRPEEASCIAGEASRFSWLIGYHNLAARLASRRGDYRAAAAELEGFLKSVSLRHTTPELVVSFSSLGTYYQQLGEHGLADAAYAKAEEVLKDHNLPPEACRNLYGNIAAACLNTGNPQRAKLYLDKLQKACPQVLHPENYQDAVICHNIGWNAFLLEDYAAAKPLLERSIRAFERLGLSQTLDYWNAKRNLGLFYAKMSDWASAASVHQEVVRGLRALSPEIQTNLRVLSAAEYLLYLYRTGQMKEARRFVRDYAGWFCAQEGFDAPDLLLQMVGAAFQGADPVSITWLLDHAKAEISKRGLAGTFYEAMLQNCIGVYHSDVEENYREALSCFRSAAAIAEALKETGHALYPIICGNIQYAQQMLAETEG